MRGLDPLVRRVLHARGLLETAATFCEPRLTDLLEPSGIPDLDRAAERLLGALRSREPVVIYGDYDVDGVTASAILLHVCLALAPGASVRTYIPHRLDEGYGLNAGAIAQLAQEGARVVVTVDCGVTAHEPARVARSLGVDLIITDHHNPPERAEDLPDAFAVVHPRRPGSGYAFGDLSGAGVAYKLAWRLATLSAGGERAPQGVRELLVDLLPFAALGAIADVVPLVGENRVLARFGLARMRGTRFGGLNALIRASSLDSEGVSAEDVGFRLAPRLNACGRLGHAQAALELLTTAQGPRAEEIARDLTRLNNERRAVEAAIFDEACARAEAEGMTGEGRRAIVLADPGWHPGVVGIVCSRLVARFGRPTILMRAADGECHGSGRSVQGVRLHAALACCSEHLLTFGGHDMAAGLRLAEKNLPAFVEAFIGRINIELPPDRLTPALRIDCDAALAELTPRAVEGLDKLGPFGQGNPSPSVRVTRVRIARAPEPLGAGGKHLALRVADAAAPGVGREMRLVGWGMGGLRDRLPLGAVIDAVVRPRINVWNGRASVEPELRDALVHSAASRPAVVPLG